MKKIITTFLFLTLILTPVCEAQKTTHQARYESFQRQKKEFLRKQIGLTDQEAARFFPLYDEMQLKKYQLNRQVRSEAKRIAHSKTPVSEKEYAASANALSLLPLKEAEIEREYFIRFKGILSPRKLFLYRRAENIFAKTMLQERGKNQQK
ncbi:hypothetical protein [Coprobacter sp.]